MSKKTLKIVGAYQLIIEGGKLDREPTPWFVQKVKMFVQVGSDLSTRREVPLGCIPGLPNMYFAQRLFEKIEEVGDGTFKGKYTVEQVFDLLTAHYRSFVPKR